MELNAPNVSDPDASTAPIPDARCHLPRVELYFATNDHATLEEIKLERPGTDHAAHLTRGANTHSDGKTGDFKWTTAVRALALLLLRHATNSSPKRTPTSLVGGEGSLAAALDYAITKQPQWLKKLFGTTEDGICYARKMIRRVNSERKRGGDVSLFIRESLQKSNILVFEDNEPLTSIEALLALAERLEHNIARRIEEQKPFTPLMSGVSLRPESSGRWSRRASSLAYVELNKSVRSEIQGNFGDTYFSIWQKNRNMRTALNAVRANFSSQIDGHLIRLTSHTDISVLNEHGDARISCCELLANCSFNPIESCLDRIWLEYPANTISVAVYDQTDGSALKWNFLRNDPCRKEVAITFPKPIAPLETAAVCVEYTVPRVFRYDAFWMTHVRPGSIRKSCSVHLDAAKPLRHCYTLSESQNGQVTEGFPSVLVKNSEALTTLHWEWEYPTAETLVKLFWAT